MTKGEGGVLTGAHADRECTLAHRQIPRARPSEVFGLLTTSTVTTLSHISVMFHGTIALVPVFVSTHLQSIRNSSSCNSVKIRIIILLCKALRMQPIFLNVKVRILTMIKKVLITQAHGPLFL